MNIEKIIDQIINDQQKVRLEEKKAELEALEQKAQDPNLWSNPDSAKKTMQEIQVLKKLIETWDGLLDSARALEEIKPLLSEDEELASDAQKQYEQLVQDLEQAEVQLLLIGPYDGEACYLHFAPGAGGTESKDFADMLLRMYIRWAEQNEYSVSIVEKKNGEEAGIDSATIKIEGPYAYGYLKGESGVHRLIRISPFNAQGLRQTSFVAIEAMPEIPDANTDFEIPDGDLRIDTFRASGAGGQAVNKTDSAVRITHLPTGLVSSCQNERSQLQNKQEAMGMLKAKLATLMLQQHAEKVSELKPDHKKIEFGSQIKTYTLQPYTLVKDHRTGQEVTDAAGVLDGNIQILLESTLRGQKIER